MSQGFTGKPFDDKAVHIDKMQEISTITEKTTIVGDDVLICEDSENLFTKVKVKMSSIVSTTTGDDVSLDTTNFDNQLSSADDTAQKAFQTLNDITISATDLDAIHKSTAGEINTVTEKTSPSTTDLIIIEDSSDGNTKKKVQVGNLPTSGGGEINTASNVGSGGVGTFKQKTGVNLEFKNINAGSNKITVTDDVTNNEIDINVSETNINHDNLANTGTNTHTDIDDFISNTEDIRQASNAYTGFSNADSIGVSYDKTTYKITLSGTFKAYYQGEEVTELTDGYVSPAHSTTGASYWLMYDGTSVAWSTTMDFNKLLIAIVNNESSGNEFGIRECHAFQSSASHRIAHDNIGTYKESGGTLSNYTLSSNTATDRRPDISQAILYDEDLKSTLSALTGSSASYSQFYLTSTNTPNFNTSQTDFPLLSGSNPYYNEWNGSAWQQTLMPSSFWNSESFMSMWVVALPTTSDTDSQEFRFVFAQGQQVSTVIEDEEKLSPKDVNLLPFTELTPESVFIAQIIIKYDGSDWTIEKVVALTGSRVSQSSTSNSTIDVNAIHDNSGAEIYSITEKTSPVDDDILLMEDSADDYTKKKIKISNLPSGSGGTDENAIHDNVASEISAITEKTTLSASDMFIIEDSGASNAKKMVKYSNISSGAIAKSIALITLSASQTSNLSTGSHVEFDTIEQEGTTSDISLATGSGQSDGIITLSGNKKYELECSLTMNFSGSLYGVVRFYDRTNSTYIGTDVNWYSINRNSSRNANLPVYAIIDASSADVSFDVRISATNTITEFTGGKCVIRIKEV